MDLQTCEREVIHDPNAPEIAQVRRLQSRAERDRRGLFLADGIRFVARALETGARIETLLMVPEVRRHPFARKLLREAGERGIPNITVTPEVYRSLSLAESPQGFAAVVRQRWETLRQVRPSGTLCWLCLETIRSPGNLGTILRTSDAVGAAGVILLGDGIDPYDPGAVRATMGAVFSQRIVRATFAELAAWKGRHRCLLVGTCPGVGVDYRAVSYARPAVLFMGSERTGLTPEQQALCDVLVRIPMVGSGDSLNVAIASAVMLYEVFSQRNPLGGRRSRRG
jgi:TrmH family RNA methyltransferase